MRGPKNAHLHKPEAKVPYDYVFFDWKGTLAKKSGMNTKQRTDLRLRRFYDALKELLQHRNSSREVAIRITDRVLDERANNADVARESSAYQLPTFEDLQQIFDRLMHQHKGEDGMRTFSWGDFLCALLRELGLGGLEQPDKEYLCTSFQVEVTADSGLYGGAEEIIRWLREEAGLPVGLIRNSKLDEQAMRKRIAKAGIDPGHFEAVVMGGEVGFVKPDPEVFVTAARTANIEHIHSRDPRRILFIGNEVDADVYGAKGVGWTSVLVTHTEPTSNGLADYEIGHLMQLKDIVLRSRDDTEEREQ